MIVIGLTGSIAMGKSEVARVLSAEGIPLFDADKEVHALYDSVEGANLLRRLAPTAIAGDKVDRATLSGLVLNEPDLLARLEEIIHAEIAKRRDTFVAAAKSGGNAVVVVDVPLLFEKGGDRDVDVSIVVSAPEHEQHRRALARPGMTSEKLNMILKRQMPDAEKRRRATYVIENNGTLEDLQAKALTVLKHIRRNHVL
jgi:dephospho-CoA kinase